MSGFVQITMEELIEFRTQKGKLKLLKTEFLALRESNRQLEEKLAGGSGAAPPPLTASHSMPSPHVPAPAAATASPEVIQALESKNKELTERVETLTRVIAVLTEEKKALAQANEEILSKTDAGEVEETLKAAQDQIDSLTNRLRLLQVDREVLSRTVKGQREDEERKVREQEVEKKRAEAALLEAAETVVEDVYENQRYVPFKGWVTTFMPSDPPNWSDEAGKRHISRDEVALPSEFWRWLAPWATGTPGATEAEGWVYSRFAMFACWHPKQKGTDLVRRRKWVRTRVHTTPGFSLVAGAVASGAAGAGRTPTAAGATGAGAAGAGAGATATPAPR